MKQILVSLCLSIVGLLHVFAQEKQFGFSNSNTPTLYQPKELDMHRPYDLPGIKEVKGKKPDFSTRKRLMENGG
jgi:hypothetical protein